MNPHPIIAALAAERRAQRITQHQLAERTGWSKRTIAGAESGTTSPTLAFAVDYAAALGMAVAPFKSGYVQAPVRRETRRRCVCGVTYQVTRHNQIRKHQCTARAQHHPKEHA